MPDEKINRDELQARYRQHLTASKAIIEAHTAVALSATSGNIRAAARILADRAAADPAFGREIDAMEQIGALLG